MLLGASGSGKSTLLNILGGLDVPTRGEVRYRDHVLTAATDRELTRYRREHVGFVFQFFNLLPSLTALENIELVTEIAANPIPTRDALEMVGLGASARRASRAVPGGGVGNSDASRLYWPLRISRSCTRVSSLPFVSWRSV